MFSQTGESNPPNDVCSGAVGAPESNSDLAPAPAMDPQSGDGDFVLNWDFKTMSTHDIVATSFRIVVCLIVICIILYHTSLLLMGRESEIFSIPN